MKKGGFGGRRVLAAEDHFLLADNLARKLQQIGLVVVGPAASVAQAMALIESEAPIDGAILDITLGREPAFPIVDELRARGVPTVFLTGLSNELTPQAYRDVPCFRKPVNVTEVARSLFPQAPGADSA